MPPFYRFCEVAIYAVLNFLPLTVMALYPFLNMLRYSKKVTALLVAALTALQIGIGIWAAFFPNGIVGFISLISTLLYAVFYIFAIKASLGKKLFTLLMLSNMANFFVVSSKCLEGQLFPLLAVQQYRWSFSLMLFLVQLVFFAPLFLYIKNVYTPAVQQKSSGVEWRFLWLIPAVFYFLWYYCIYCIRGLSSLDVALRPSNTVFFAIINFGACLIYYVITILIKEQELNTTLEAQNHQLSIQSLQYENLQEKILDAQRARHDLHHHITVLNDYLKKHEYEKLENYLTSYAQGLPDMDSIVLCQNTAVNALLLYFAGLAKEHGIDFTSNVDVPENVCIPETDLSVLLGNLLENALEACIANKAGNNKIIIRANADSASLCLTVDNTFHGQIRKSRNGNYLSTKHKGEGIGIESVKSIVARYRGTLRLEQKDGMFYVSVLLNI